MKGAVIGSDFIPSPLRMNPAERKVATANHPICSRPINRPGMT